MFTSTKFEHKIIKKILTAALVLFALMSSSALAADFRIWTSVKGSSLEAQLTSYDDGVVNLTTKESKAIKLKAADLSLADRQYLIEFTDAKEDLLYKVKSSVPEHQYRKPKYFLKKLEEKLSLGDSELEFNLYETEHFMFAASSGITPKGIAETAEACWHGMSFQHYEFRENWGTTKFLIVLPKDENLYKAIGKYVVAELKKANQTDHANNVAATWDMTGSNYLTVPQAAIEKHNLKKHGRIFNTKDSKDYRKDFDPFQTHVISSALFTKQIGGISSISGSGYFAISTGHAYYKEIRLAQKTETNLISKEYDAGIGSKSGFADGTSWANSLKKLVKKEEIKPDIIKTLAIKDASELDPNKLVTMYALSYYLQSTQKHIANYAKLVRIINTSDQIPAPTEMAKIFGFETVEAFQADWIEFIKSKNFK